MKKLIVMLTVCLFVVAGKVSAQAGGGKVSTNDFHFLKEGLNKLSSADGKETVQIIMRGDKFSEVQFLDAAGKKTRLLPAQGVINGAPKPDCNSRVPVQFFNNSANTIGLFICTSDQPAAAGTEATKFYKLDQLVNVPGATGKAQNRRVEVKLTK